MKKNIILLLLFSIVGSTNLFSQTTQFDLPLLSNISKLFTANLAPAGIFNKTFTNSLTGFSSGENFKTITSFDSKNQLFIQTSNGKLSRDFASLSPPDQAANSFPYGKLKFSVNELEFGSSTIVTLVLPENAAIQRYWKYGPTPNNPNDHWYEFMYNGEVGAEINGNVISLHYIDGALGDDDLSENGIIVDPGGPTIGTPTFDLTSNAGDVDFNGSVQSFDAAKTLQYSVGLDPFPDVDPAPWTTERITAADVDGNGLVQAYDAAMIQQYVIGLIDSLPIESGTPKQQVSSESIALSYYQDGSNLIVASNSVDGLFASNIELRYSTVELGLDSAVTTDLGQDYMAVQNNSGGILHIGIMNIQPSEGSGDLIRIPIDVINDSASIEIREIVNSQDQLVHNIALYRNPLANGNNSNIPMTNQLYQNYPNPFNPTTTIKYDLKSDARVVLNIYNVRGERIKTIVNTNKPAGSYQEIWDGTNELSIPVASGMYISRIQIGTSYTKINRMILLR